MTVALGVAIEMSVYVPVYLSTHMSTWLLAAPAPSLPGPSMLPCCSLCRVCCPSRAGQSANLCGDCVTSPVVCHSRTRCKEPPPQAMWKQAELAVRFSQPGLMTALQDQAADWAQRCADVSLWLRKFNTLQVDMCGWPGCAWGGGRGEGRLGLNNAVVLWNWL